MRTLVFVLIAFGMNNALAGDDACIATAKKALAKAGQALGMGKGLAHLGGSEILKTTKNENGNTLVTVGGGVLTSTSSGDWYISGTAATIETIQTKSGCKVNKISISTGADFQAVAESTDE